MCEQLETVECQYLHEFGAKIYGHRLALQQDFRLKI